MFNNIKDKDIFDSVKKAIATNDGNDIDLATAKLLEFALDKGVTGNLWKKYLLYTLIYNENPYTLSIERGKSKVKGNAYVDKELKEYFDLYSHNASFIDDLNELSIETKEKRYVAEVLDELESKIGKNSFEVFKNTILDFYKERGVGHLALYKAFRVNDEGGLHPIKHVLNIKFDDLIGYDAQKQQLMQNTECFIEGKPFNNVLLYGDSGTGKSTSIKALLNKYFDQGVRIIEIYKHEMSRIPKIIYTLKSRPYFYILYMDDLSFEENESDYKYLKSVIEGGIEPSPKNVVVYATSNRRHLIKETIADNGTVMDDLHRNETQAEKLSLAYRFGLQLFYSGLSPMEFRSMVKELALRNGIEMDEQKLIVEASAFQMRYGSLSGRCAQQFINYISNKYNKIQ